MKKLKNLLLVLSTIAILLGQTSLVLADTNEEIPETVVIDGVERNVKIVTIEEYYADESGDFLVVLPKDGKSQFTNFAPEKVENDLRVSAEALSATPMSSLGKIAVYIGKELTSWVTQKGIELVVTNPKAQAAAIKAASYLLTIAPHAVMIAVGVAVVYMAVQGVNYLVQRYMNKNSCVWRGTSIHQGQWDCPMFL